MKAFRLTVFAARLVSSLFQMQQPMAHQQFTHSPTTIHRKIWLTRHGQSEYNRRGLLGGDSDISAAGECYAFALPSVLLSRQLLASNAEHNCGVEIWTSTLKRTIQTARHLQLSQQRWSELDEIDAGVCDGMTYAEIAEKMPEEYQARKKDKLGYRYPNGESYTDLIARLKPVIKSLETLSGSVCIVGHQAVLRVIYGYLMAVPLEKIPSLDMPLHTLIELTPQSDGTMSEEFFPVDINTDIVTTEQVPGPLTPACSEASAPGGHPGCISLLALQAQPVST